MTEFVCIVCPNGCELRCEQCGKDITVSGNMCARGEKFARSELTDPQRTVCTTVRTLFPETPVLPVRVSGEIPKERIFDVMTAVNSLVLDRRVGRGEIIIPNVLGLGVDVIATSGVLLEGKSGD